MLVCFSLWLISETEKKKKTILKSAYNYDYCIVNIKHVIWQFSVVFCLFLFVCFCFALLFATLKTKRLFFDAWVCCRICKNDDFMMDHTLQHSYLPLGKTCDVSSAVPRDSQLTTTANSSCLTQALSVAYWPNSLFADKLLQWWVT